MKLRKFLLVLFFYSLIFSNSYSIEPDVFVQSTVNRASNVLSKDISKEQKINEFLNINDKGIKFTQEHLSTKSRKTLTLKSNKIQCKKIIIEFLKKYVEEEFWDTDTICPLITNDKKISKHYNEL